MVMCTIFSISVTKGFRVVEVDVVSRDVCSVAGFHIDGCPVPGFYVVFFVSMDFASGYH